jgi:hypothetical protein
MSSMRELLLKHRRCKLQHNTHNKNYVHGATVISYDTYCNDPIC